jgi:hypothetical protein
MSGSSIKELTKLDHGTLRLYMSRAPFLKFTAISSGRARKPGRRAQFLTGPV